jgi:hypothetical protein
MQTKESPQVNRTGGTDKDEASTPEVAVRFFGNWGPTKPIHARLHGDAGQCPCQCNHHCQCHCH